MTDWFHLFDHTLWILGAAIILIAFSHSDWSAGQRGIRLRQVLGEAAFQRVLSFGLSLISLSLLLLAENWPERLVWALFIGVFMLQFWQVRPGRKLE